MTDQVEARLRNALHARAGQITQERLSLGVPPTIAAARPPLRWWRRLPAPIGAAVVAVVLSLTMSPGGPDLDPVPGGPAPVSPAAPVTPSVSSAVTSEAEPASSSPVGATTTPSRSAPSRSAAASPGSGPETTSSGLSPDATPASPDAPTG